MDTVFLQKEIRRWRHIPCISTLFLVFISTQNPVSVIRNFFNPFWNNDVYKNVHCPSSFSFLKIALELARCIMGFIRIFSRFVDQEDNYSIDSLYIQCLPLSSGTESVTGFSNATVEVTNPFNTEKQGGSKGGTHVSHFHTAKVIIFTMPIKGFTFYTAWCVLFL